MQTGTKAGEFPLIRSFQTPSGQHYTYDVNSNVVFHLDRAASELLGYWKKGTGIKDLSPEMFSRFSEAELQSALKTIRTWSRKGYLSSHRPEKFCFTLNEVQLRNQLNSHLNQLILGVTEQCNLRCRYCIYGDTYEQYRIHQPMDMSEETAIKAMAFFFEHSSEEKENYISFYGGEPLLNLELIKTCVSFCNTHYPHRLKHYNLNTNGICLNTDAADFLAGNDVTLRISLDGPENIHNANRIFSNGQGSFKKVINNMAMLKKRHPEYYRKKVSIMSVTGWPYNISDTYDFFNSNSLFEDLQLGVDGVNPFGTTYYDLYPMESGYKGYLSLREKYVRQMSDQKEAEPFLSALFDRRMTAIAQRDIDSPLGDIGYPNNICIPGVRRLFVDVNGKFQPCEKFNNTIYIGDVWNGFDEAAIWRLIQSYTKICQESCRDCWAQRLCSACYVSCLNDDIDAERKAEFCKLERDILLKSLILYFSIVEENPQSFEKLKEISYE